MHEKSKALLHIFIRIDNLSIEDKFEFINTKSKGAMLPKVKCQFLVELIDKFGQYGVIEGIDPIRFNGLDEPLN
jgi:hypothetical protein